MKKEEGKIVKVKQFPFPFEFSELCLMVEAKIITLSHMVLSICKRKCVRKLYYKLSKGGKVSLLELAK